MGRLDLIILAAAAAAAQTYTGAATVIHHASISNEVRCSARCVKPAVNHTYPGPALRPLQQPSNRPTGLRARSALAIKVGDRSDYLRVTNASYGRRPRRRRLRWLLKRRIGELPVEVVSSPLRQLLFRCRVSVAKRQ